LNFIYVFIFTKSRLKNVFFEELIHSKEISKRIGLEGAIK
jgi:hypothetical protein